MVDRIKQLIEIQGLTPAAFAETININRSGLSHLFSGRNQPSLDLIMKILETFPDVSTEWLMFGKGNMMQASSASPVIPTEVSPMPPSSDSFRPPDLFTQSVLETVATRENLPITNNEVVNVNKEETIKGIEKKASIVSKRKRSKKEPSFSNVEDIPTTTSNKNAVDDSREVKAIEKIIFFYVDNTFTVFEPKK